MRPQRYGTGTLMLLVAVAALAAALAVQHFRTTRREFWFRADLARLTPAPVSGGDGKMALVGDRLVIAFHPVIYRREPGTRFCWRFELVDPSGGAVAISRRYDREVEVPAGRHFSPGYLEVIDRLPPPGKYLGRFILSLYEPGSGGSAGWIESPVYTEPIALPPRSGVEAGGKPSRGARTDIPK